MLENQTKSARLGVRLLSVVIVAALVATVALGFSTQAFGAFSSESAEKVIGVGRIQSSSISESVPEPEARFAVETLTTNPAAAEPNVLATPLERIGADEAARRLVELTAPAIEAAAKAAEGTGVDPQPVLLPIHGVPIVGANPTGNNLAQNKQDFVNEWTPRIDAYLAGSPLAGMGFVFANASYDYNVDPRWSPAIACVESNKGRINLGYYNAWGWGDASWPNWETAIYTHVKGLSIGYGYTVSQSGAQKYCPTNAEYWYRSVLGEMGSI
jgi:hypothetical protein